MKGKLIKIKDEWWVETFDSHKYNYPQQIEIHDAPLDFEFKAYREVEFDTIEIEDYVGFAGHTGYPTFTIKAIIL